MRKKFLKSVKSVIIASALCAGLALGAFAAASGAELGDHVITVAAWPGFIEGIC